MNQYNYLKIEDHPELVDAAAKGIPTLYLLTDHTGFYERYGWQFLCMVQGDGGPEMSRMYQHQA